MKIYTTLVFLCFAITASTQTVSMHIQVRDTVATILYSNVENVDTLAFKPINNNAMADTYKHIEQAKIKQGDAEYKRHKPRKNPKATKPKVEEIETFKNIPAVEEGFWKRAKSWLSGL